MLYFLPAMSRSTYLFLFTLIYSVYSKDAFDECLCIRGAHCIYMLLIRYLSPQFYLYQTMVHTTLRLTID
jgi:hypothetical protein